MYDTHEDAWQKLGNTIILYKDEPVRVIVATGSYPNIKLSLQGVTPGNTLGEFVERLDSVYLDYRSLGTRLGYMNYNQYYPKYSEACFMSRIPIRRSTQGLSDETVWCSDLEHIPEDLHYHIDHRFKNRAHCVGFAEMMQNKYPTLRDALKTLFTSSDCRTHIYSVAVSRETAVSWDRVGVPYLLYKRRKIGSVSDNEKITLAKQYEYLHEGLEDKGVHIALIR